VLYTGIAGSLSRRINEHENELIDGFTSKYKCKYLVFYQHFQYVNDAISREKQIKKWSREKKEALISKFNPDRVFVNKSIPSIEKVYCEKQLY
jgi:putative endonuclease